MTDDDSTANGDGDAADPDGADSTANADGDAGDPDEVSDRLDALEATVETLTDRIPKLERAVAWMARQQAAETGNSVCPYCNTAGALTVSRTPAGKKQVECTNCGETLN